MRTAHRPTASAIRTASVLFISAFASIGVTAAPVGSTDIYALDGVPSSFGAAPKQMASLRAPGEYLASTDTWGVNGFRASFGSADPTAPTATVCRRGSTDIYELGGFVASFGAPAYQAAIDLAQACGMPATVLR
jgi:hypothetical protein